ncbi:cytochrome P450 family protein [Xylariaceae sp. FL0255]|nr:cytochrome P450 family protein [Xylariaceae sp. FL0255]
MKIITLESALATLFAATCLYVIYECFFSPLAKFPGPFIAKFSRFWRIKKHWTNQWHHDVLDLHRTYGPVVRISPNELSVADPDAFREIYRVKDTFKKGPSYAILQGKRPFDLAGERNETVHGMQRKLVARPYTMESMRSLEPQIRLVMEEVLEKLDAAAANKSSQDIDLGYLFQLFAFDVIGAVSFAQPFGFVKAFSDNGLFTRIQRSMKSTSWIMQAGGFYDFHETWVRPIFGNFLAANDRNGYFFEFAKRQVTERKEKGIAGDNDMVGQLFQAQQTKNQPDDLSISFMMATNVFAGSDTTSSTMRAAFLHLMEKPEIIDKIRAELQDRCPGRAGELYTSEECSRCEYLQAVIYEALRILPPVAMTLDREVPERGMTIRGKFVPGGTVVGSSAWTIHRMPEIWGDDAEEFQPERWLNKETVGELKRYFFSFGGGTRTCIGRNIAWLELEVLLATLLMRYDFKLADDAKVEEDCGLLVLLLGVKAQVTRREI